MSETGISRLRWTAAISSCRTTRRWSNCSSGSASCGGGVRPCSRRSVEATHTRAARALSTDTATSMATITVTDLRLLSLLHFGDSAFPTGGYAHSFGLETYCQAGLVRGREGLERFLVAQLEGSSGPCDATAAVGVLVAAASDGLGRCRAIDAMLEAMKPVREFREASRQMGHQTLRVAATLTGESRVAAYAEDVGKSLAPGHHAVAYGLAAAALGWAPEATATAFLYSSTALLVGA